MRVESWGPNRNAGPTAPGIRPLFQWNGYDLSGFDTANQFDGSDLLTASWAVNATAFGIPTIYALITTDGSTTGRRMDTASVLPFNFGARTDVIIRIQGLVDYGNANTSTNNRHGVGFTARYNLGAETTTGYLYGANTITSTNKDIWRMGLGPTETSIATPSSIFHQNQLVHWGMTLIIAGDQHKFWFDGADAVYFADSNHSSGRFGLAATGSAQRNSTFACGFFDVRVWDLEGA